MTCTGPIGLEIRALDLDTRVSYDSNILKATRIITDVCTVNFQVVAGPR